MGLPFGTHEQFTPAGFGRRLADDGAVRKGAKSALGVRLQLLDRGERQSDVILVVEIGVNERDPSTYYVYAMNIHLEMATSKRTAKLNWVPIIIDPDTGNMGGPPLPDA